MAFTTSFTCILLIFLVTEAPFFAEFFDSFKSRIAFLCEHDYFVKVWIVTFWRMKLIKKCNILSC